MWFSSVAKRKGESSEIERWAGLRFDLQRAEIWVVDADRNRERAPEFQAVIKAMQCIPYPPERSDEIQQAAFNIAYIAMFAAIHDQPNLQQNAGGTAADLRELQRAHDLCFELAAHLYQMHRGSRDALEKHDPGGLRKFQREVGRWSNCAHEAWSELNGSEPRASRRGRPTKDVEAAIRPVALREFERLTDGPVARKHPDYPAFVKFLYCLFGALGLDPQNAASQARSAVEERDDGLDKIGE